MPTKNSSRSLFIVSLNFIFTLTQSVQSFHQHRKYFHLTNRVTWSEAQTYCREHHTDLVSFNSKSELDAMQDLCPSFSFCWIGLHRDEYHSNVWVWSGGEAATFTHWSYLLSQPNGSPGFEDCVATAFKFWFDLPCHHQKEFLCYEDDLILVKENKTWEEALEHCSSLDTDTGSNNTHLYVPSGDTNFAKRAILAAQTEEVWIGLRFLAGNWLWVNGNPLREQLPTCPAPEKHCGLILISKTGGLLQPSNCLEKRNFLACLEFRACMCRCLFYQFGLSADVCIYNFETIINKLNYSSFLV